MQNIYELSHSFIQEIFPPVNKKHQESGICYNNLNNNTASDKKISELTAEIKELKAILKNQNH